MLNASQPNQPYYHQSSGTVANRTILQTLQSLAFINTAQSGVMTVHYCHNESHSTQFVDTYYLCQVWS